MITDRSNQFYGFQLQWRCDLTNITVQDSNDTNDPVVDVTSEVSNHTTINPGTDRNTSMSTTTAEFVLQINSTTAATNIAPTTYFNTKTTRTVINLQETTVTSGTTKAPNITTTAPVKQSQGFGQTENCDSDITLEKTNLHHKNDFYDGVYKYAERDTNGRSFWVHTVPYQRTYLIKKVLKFDSAIFKTGGWIIVAEAYMRRDNALQYTSIRFYLNSTAACPITSTGDHSWNYLPNGLKTVPADFQRAVGLKLFISPVTTTALARPITSPASISPSGLTTSKAITSPTTTWTKTTTTLTTTTTKNGLEVGPNICNTTHIKLHDSTYHHGNTYYDGMYNRTGVKNSRALYRMDILHPSPSQPTRYSFIEWTGSESNGSWIIYGSNSLEGLLPTIRFHSKSDGSMICPHQQLHWTYKGNGGDKDVILMFSVNHIGNIYVIARVVQK